MRLGIATALLALSAVACRTTEPPPDYPPIDAELLAPEDPFAAHEDPEWTDYARRNAVPIRSLTSTDYSDLQFLKPLLAGKTLVQLGESGHGVGEFDAAKVRLVRFLHEQMGFDVIAFEAGFYECWVADSIAAVATSLSTMKNCAYSIWWADETIPLFDYIKAQRATATPLTLAGFDVQPRLNELTLGYRAMLTKLIAPTDSAFAKQADTIEGLWQANKLLHGMGSPPDSVQLLLSHYLRIDSLLVANKTALEATHGQQAVTLARMLMASRQAYIRQITRVAIADRLAARDSGMAENISTLLQTMYPGKKVIVWAHNAHVRHSNQSVSPSTYAFTSMGSWLAQRHRAELYTIGLYMYSGTAADNARKVYTVVRSFPSSLESVTYHSRLKYAFFDFSQVANTSASSWIFQPLFAMDWGNQLMTLVPRDQYDGVIVINNTHPPTYIP